MSSSPLRRRCRILRLAPQHPAILLAHLLPLSDTLPPPDAAPPVPNPLLEHALTVPLADFPAPEVLESGAKRAIHIVILAQEAVLSWVTERVQLVTPVAAVVEPADRCGGVELGGEQRVGSIVIRVRVHVLDRVPEGSAVRHVVQNAAGENIGVKTGCGVHGMCARGRESNRLFPC